MNLLPPVQIGKIGKMGINQQYCSIMAMSPTLWLDAADPFSIIENDGKVNEWKDKSGNGNHIIQSTDSYKPLSGNENINDLNVINFDGVDDYLYNTSPFMYDASALTIFTVHKAPLQENKWVITEARHNSNSPIYALFVSGASEPEYNKPFIRTDNGNTPVNASVEFTTPYYNGAPVIATMKDVNSKITAYANGIIGTPATLSYTCSDTISLTRFSIGALLRSSQQYAMQINIGEIIVFTKDLSIFEMNKVGYFLAKKWGISWTHMC